MHSVATMMPEPTKNLVRAFIPVLLFWRGPRTTANFSTNALAAQDCVSSLCSMQISLCWRSESSTEQTSSIHADNHNCYIIRLLARTSPPFDRGKQGLQQGLRREITIQQNFFLQTLQSKFLPIGVYGLGHAIAEGNQNSAR